jgi:hypothetical protein
MLHAFLRAALAMALVFTVSASAADNNDIAELKQMLEQMKREYESRIAAMEVRIAEAERKAELAGNRADRAAQVAAAPPAPATVQARAGGQRAANTFNPAISLVLQGSGTSYSRDPDTWRLPGFQLGGEAGLREEGLSATESELTLSANADDWFFAQATLGLHDEDGSTETDLEEAFVDTLGLPAGLGMRFGRFYAETGYVNTKHTHAWDFVDAPLTSQAFLGYQYRDDGVRLTWLAPTDQYLEFGVEALRGERFPAGSNGDGLTGDAKNYFVRTGGDAGISNSYRLGLSHLRTDPDDRESGHGHGDHADESFSFSGDSNLTMLDFTWKWAPDGDARRRNFVFSTEYFYRDEDGTVTFIDEIGQALLPYEGTQHGAYVQGVYQFMPRWRVGLRYDRLWSDNDVRVTGNTAGESDDAILEESGLLGEDDPYRWTLMSDYSHSEFSRLRLQYVRDNARPGAADDQFYLQYIMTLGAHGAHKY